MSPRTADLLTTVATLTAADLAQLGVAMVLRLDGLAKVDPDGAAEIAAAIVATFRTERLALSDWSRSL